jgi:prolyl-tRNA synthetase
VEGFAPELALVTRGGGKELEEPLVVRPTSETVVNHMFAQWIHSYRDLPLLINQWANVHRWEMRTRPFIRTLEFLWQEGHTAHATAAEAEAEAQAMITLYSRFAYEVAALPVVVGRKSKTESFAGADITYTIEAMMGDGKALQAGTSHNLGQNFAKAFDIQFTDEDGARRHVWQTSWGVSTRMVGGVIMAHGDDTGLRLPPALAPTQLVVVPIWKTEAEKPSVLAAAQGIADAATGAGLRVHVDAREGRTPGWKYNHWEMKGVPLRCEVGPRDVAAGTCVLARRDVPGKAGKTAGVPLEAVQLVATLRTALDEVQASLLAQATAFRDAHIVDVSSYEHLQKVVDSGCWARGPWSGSVEDEARVKTETGATFRCYPFEQPKAGHGMTCFMTGKPATEVAIFAKAY